MSDFNSIENTLENLKIAIKKFTNDLDFKEEFEFTLADSNKDFITEQITKLNYQGIYFLEIYSDSNNQNFNNWKNDFSKKWKKDNIKKSPLLAVKRLEKCIDFNAWIPFYLGKSENISNRIAEHLFLEKDKTTSALKLSSRTSFKNDKFRLSTIKIETKHYDLVMHKIEENLRNKFNPIVGKQ